MQNTRGGEDRTPRAARPEDRPTQFHHIEKRLKKSRLIVAGTTLLTAAVSVFTRGLRPVPTPLRESAVLSHSR